MSTDTHVIDLLPAYALDCLDLDEVEMVAAHLSHCPTCRTELQVYRHLSGELALAARETTPPAALRDKLMRIIQPAPAAPRRSWWQALVMAFSRPVPAWSMAGLVVFMLLVGGSLLAWPTFSSRTIPVNTMQPIALRSTTAASSAQGMIIVSSDGLYGAMVVEDLPRLDPDHQYQLWLIKDGQRTNGGVFSVDANGYQTMTITAPQPLDRYTAFGITVEPAGGSSAPTGHKVLAGTF